MSKGTKQDSGWQQRKRWTERDAQRALAAWRGSGQPLSSFARSHGLEVQRVTRWRKRLGSAEQPRDEGETSLRFIPARVRPEEGEYSVCAALVVIRLPNGTSVEVKELEGTSARWISSLVRRLGESGR
jgi:transposase-like protein